ncbi:hypothetical protein U9M48_013258 [Paspalum notatum var. saurae]|uniref:Uncharacterized protein n=1 Tax=Paspalum notatum var. saurae TaxID=547442 RepID=A0AAQ3SZ56_PASNO
MAASPFLMAPLTSLNLPHHECKKMGCCNRKEEDRPLRSLIRAPMCTVAPWNRKQQQYRPSSAAHHRVYSAAATNPMEFSRFQNKSSFPKVLSGTQMCFLTNGQDSANTFLH